MQVTGGKYAVVGPDVNPGDREGTSLGPGLSIHPSPPTTCTVPPAAGEGLERARTQFKVTQLPERWILPNKEGNLRWATVALEDVNLDLLGPLLGLWKRPGGKELPGERPSGTDVGLCHQTLACLGAQGPGLPVFRPLWQMGTFLKPQVPCSLPTPWTTGRNSKAAALSG